MSATISSLVSGATPPPTATADTRDSSATQPLAPAQLSPFPSPSTSMTDNSAASIHVPSTSDPSSFDPIPRARANSFPTSKRERSAAEARQAAAEASGKSGWKKRWRKIRNLFKAMRGAFRSSSKSDVGSVMEKDERGLLMVPKRKHKAMIITEELPPPMPPVPPLPPQVNVDRIGVRSAPNHHISKPSPSHATAVDDTDDDSTPLALLSSPNLAPPRIPAIAFPPTLSSTNDTSPLPSPPLPQTTPPQLLITLDDGYVYEAFTIERAHVVFPRRSTDSTVPTVDRRRRVRRRSKTPTAADEDEQQPAMTISAETANAHDEDEAPPLPSPTPSWGSSESLERSSVLASTLDRMLRRNREAPGSAESAAAQQEVEEAGVADHCGYFTATDTESELGSPAVGPSAVPAVTPADEKAHDEAFVAEANNRSPTDSLPPTTTSPSLNRESMSSFDLADLAHSTPLPLSPTSFHFISSSPPASSVSLTPSDSGVAHDDEHEPAEPAHGPVDDTATHSDEAADAPAAAAASPPSIQITLDDGFAYDAFTIERAHKVFPRRAAEPGSGVPTIDRRRRVRRRTEVGGGEQHQKKQAPMSVE